MHSCTAGTAFRSVRSAVKVVLAPQQADVSALQHKLQAAVEQALLQRPSGHGASSVGAQLQAVCEAAVAAMRE